MLEINREESYVCVCVCVCMILLNIFRKGIVYMQLLIK